MGKSLLFQRLSIGKKASLPILASAILLLLFISCKKGDIKTTEVPQVSSDKELISQAKAFFELKIVTQSWAAGEPQNERQKAHKTVLWERAVVRTSSVGEVVTIPLKYEKNWYFDHDGKGEKLPLEKLSNLLVYKNAAGDFKAQVVTYLTKGNVSDDIDKNFNGIILIDDWGGNRIDRFLIEDSKRFRFTGNPTSQRLSSYEGCYSIVWYICDEINGQLSNCEYLFTEYAAACNEGLEACYDNCLNENIEYEVEVLKNASYSWNVTAVSNEGGGGHVRATHSLAAKFNNRRSERNRFIGQYYYGGNVISLPGNIYASLLSHTTYEHSGTVNSNTQMTLKDRGKYTLPDQWFFEYDNSTIISLYSCCNWQ